MPFDNIVSTNIEIGATGAVLSHHIQQHHTSEFTTPNILF
jgi:hypothetical protein